MKTFHQFYGQDMICPQRLVMLDVAREDGPDDSFMVKGKLQGDNEEENITLHGVASEQLGLRTDTGEMQKLEEVDAWVNGGDMILYGNREKVAALARRCLAQAGVTYEHPGDETERSRFRQLL